jgi:signal transduction histidine kinase
MKLEDLSQMTAAIAHEIRNPLSSIKAASGLMTKELQGLSHPTCLEYHTLITEEVERLNHILATFQDFTRPLRVEKDPVSINELIQRTTKLVDVGAPYLEIRLELSADLPPVQADPSLMKQVFINLIKNAAEACHPVSWSSRRVCLSLGEVNYDNGPGISPELLSRIFEPFFTTKTTGMGVGLAICQKIVEAHQGRIEAIRPVSGGTQFSVFLPV